ncbi:hypothetical protein EJB05_55089, partial [Eragrostis curvula]
MESASDVHGRRHKCACFRQFNKVEHLVEHMRSARHSAHDPSCGVCGKHCRSFEALRDHLGAGGCSPVPNAAQCASLFAARGCTLCLHVLPDAAELGDHRAKCQLPRTRTISVSRPPSSEQQRQGGGGGGALALGGGGGGGGGRGGCKMVGAGSDGTLDVCARVCVVDELTHYRYETTGIRPEHLHDAGVTVKKAQQRVQELLLNGEEPWKARTSRGRARLLVGHGLDHDLQALGMDYPAYLKRDTATYPPLMKTSRLSNSLRFLTRTYLGYDIQTGHQHPYEDCVAAMRLYRKMRAQPHPKSDAADDSSASVADNVFPAWRQRELERMTPEDLLRMSTPDYYCWCLDSIDG